MIPFLRPEPSENYSALGITQRSWDLEIYPYGLALAAKQYFQQGLSLGVSIAIAKHYNQKEDGKKKVYLAYASVWLFFFEGCQDMNSNVSNLGAGASAETMDACCLVASFT